MKPVEFEGQTIVMGPPAGTPKGACGALPVRVSDDPTFKHRFSSFWKPDAAELAALNKGAHVHLSVFGQGQVPVWLEVNTAVKELP